FASDFFKTMKAAVAIAADGRLAAPGHDGWRKQGGLSFSGFDGGGGLGGGGAGGALGRGGGGVCCVGVPFLPAPAGGCGCGWLGRVRCYNTGRRPTSDPNTREARVLGAPSWVRQLANSKQPFAISSTGLMVSRG